MESARLWFANTGSTAKAVAEMRVFGAPTPPQSVSKYYFLGKQRVAIRQNGKLTYLHGDQLGSAILATDATGVTLSQQRYLPYGGLRWAQSGSVFPTDWQYTDQQRQSTHLTGIGMVEYYDYRARMYDPKIGRFISPDSVVPDEKNPQSLNRYAYALGNPIKYVDPSGHFPIVLPIGASAVATVAAAGAVSGPPGWVVVGGFLVACVIVAGVAYVLTTEYDKAVEQATQEEATNNASNASNASNTPEQPLAVEAISRRTDEGKTVRVRRLNDSEVSREMERDKKGYGMGAADSFYKDIKTGKLYLGNDDENTDLQEYTEP